MIITILAFIALLCVSGILALIGWAKPEGGPLMIAVALFVILMVALLNLMLIPIFMNVSISIP